MIKAKNTDADFYQRCKAAKNCVQLFQRSSSCIEGRNAQLALRHQGIHRLGRQQLKVTTVHNYYIKKRDGTAAAKRFFEAEHRDLFTFFAQNMEYPVLPKIHIQKVA